jgi:hypothetical protein
MGGETMNKLTVSALALSAALWGGMALAEAVKATPGQDVPMVLLPKFLGILVFDQANRGAQEAHAEMGNPGELLFQGPTPENSVAGQIEIMTTRRRMPWVRSCCPTTRATRSPRQPRRRRRGHQGRDLGQPDPRRCGRGLSSWRRSTSDPSGS